MPGEQRKRASSMRPVGGSAAISADAHAGEGIPALVLLHGFGGSHHVWDGVRAALPPSQHTIAYDLPGHGNSLSLSAEGVAPAFAKTILTDLQARKLGPIHLVGHSLGGAVSILMALFEPQRIASLTLLAPGGLGSGINAQLLRDFAGATSQQEILVCLRAMAVPEFSPSVDLVQQSVAERAATGQVQALQDLCARITFDGRQGAFTLEQLSSLAMPVHVVWGDKDPVLPFAQTLNIPSSFTFHPQAGLGHMLPIEAPEAMARLISRVISG